VVLRRGRVDGRSRSQPSASLHCHSTTDAAVLTAQGCRRVGVVLCGGNVDLGAQGLWDALLRK